MSSSLINSVTRGSMDHLAQAQMKTDLSKDNKILNSKMSELTKGKDLKKVSEEFESLFLEIVLRSMRNTVQKSGLIDGGNAEDIYRGLLDVEYAKMLSSQRQTGLSDSIENYLRKSVENTVNDPNNISNPIKKVENSHGIQAYRAAMRKELEIEHSRPVQKKDKISNDEI